MKNILLILAFAATLAHAEDTRYETQFKLSYAKLMANSTRADVYPGMVIASPSKDAPNYFYDWVRDTSLTLRSIVEVYKLNRDPKLKKMIKTWVASEARRQGLPALTGLGEPRYRVDGYADTNPWGRPQNDGPALRTLTTITFARLLIEEGEGNYVAENIYRGGNLPSLIKLDLDYIVKEWKKPCYDLWEEDYGIHFYTQLAQYTALKEGAEFVYAQGDETSSDIYAAAAGEIANALQEYRDSKLGIKTSLARPRPVSFKNMNLDSAPMLALIHTYPYQDLFKIKDKDVVKYIGNLKAAFKDAFDINRTSTKPGIALGRYPEDRYDGVNPNGEGSAWFLLTLGLGEYYCLSGDRSSAAIDQFDRFFEYSGDGSLTEQFNRTTGEKQGAIELTWSHNSVLTSTLRCGLVKL